MSDKVRVHEIAKELGIASKEVVDKASAMGLSVKTASSSVSMEEAEKIMNYIMNGPAPEPAPKPKIVKKAAAKPEAEEASAEKTTEETPKDETAAKAQEVKKEETPAAAAKEDSKAPKTEEAAEAAPKKEKKPLLKEAAPIKRSGLKIVKKKKAKPAQSEESSFTSSDDVAKLSSYGKMSEEARKELESKKKKSAPKSAPTKKQDQGQRLDIFGGGMADVSMDLDGEEVVLLDLNAMDQTKPREEEPVRKPREKKPVGRGGGQKKGGGQRRSVARGKRRKYTKEKQADEVVTHVEIPEDIRVYEFAEKLKRPMSDIIKVLFDLGMMVTKNDFLGKDEIEILAEEFEIEVTTIDPKDAFDYEGVYEGDTTDEEHMVERPPVITIMGHVDHGKTSLLDAIRDAKVVDSEAGGITQHIGAYTIDQHGKKITFIDTPGHAAFSAMRERGAQATDIIIIVVAADDGVKPQTEEAIKLAKDAGAPVIVAINKMDKEAANPDLVKGQMAEKEMTPVDWGGDIEFIPLSAKTGDGIEDLLENILIQAEVLELKANPDTLAKAVVVESSLEKGRGPVATVIVQNGTLKVGDSVVCGSAYGRVRALIDNHKKQIKEIGLSESAVV
ncbi:MAG: translation initiation factor IF-2, partial [Sulfurimonadaceae bacterium]|nr:translation initiation factor IF-2 [Sulfurimonadaceae bacterium]